MMRGKRVTRQTEAENGNTGLENGLKLRPRGSRRVRSAWFFALILNPATKLAAGGRGACYPTLPSALEGYLFPIYVDRLI